MSWSGTVTCSSCWTEGHNKRSCPKERERLEERAADGCEYSKNKLKRNETKRCSFCGNNYHKDEPLKHNSRTCGWRKKFETEIVGKVIKARTRVLKEAELYGCFRGSLVEWQKNEYYDGKYQEVTKIGMIDSIPWQEITHKAEIDKEGYAQIPYMRVQIIGGDYNGETTRVPMPPEPFDPNGIFQSSEAAHVDRAERIRRTTDSCRVVSPSIKNAGPESELFDPRLVAKEENVKDLVNRQSGHHDRNGPS